METRAYRITYLRADGELGHFYITEENSYYAGIAFVRRTGYPWECIQTVEVQLGRRWSKLP